MTKSSDPKGLQVEVRAGKAPRLVLFKIIFHFSRERAYILKVGISGNRDSANFFHFPPKFRLRTRKPSRVHCTIASPSVCRVCFVLNINTSYIDLLYFDNLLLKTPDLCNLRTFDAIFLSQFTHFFRQFLEAKKQTPPIYPLLECMSGPLG